jgi:maltodextrin utilization protein YvdJ
VTEHRSRWLNILLILILAYILAAIIGWLVEGLLWLFAIAATLFVLTILWVVYRTGRRRGRHVR